MTPRCLSLTRTKHKGCLPSESLSSKVFFPQLRLLHDKRETGFSTSSHARVQRNRDARDRPGLTPTIEQSRQLLGQEESGAKQYAVLGHRRGQAPPTAIATVFAEDCIFETVPSTATISLLAKVSNHVAPLPRK